MSQIKCTFSKAMLQPSRLSLLSIHHRVNGGSAVISFLGKQETHCTHGSFQLSTGL